MILNKIVLKRMETYNEIMKDVPLDKIIEKSILRVIEDENFFYNALAKDGMSFICEVKKASPSKGLIKKDFNYLEIAKEYEKNGASAISCLTEPEFFLGKDEYLTNLKKEINIPILRKDFIFSDYQIYEAKAIGADAILLICSILNDQLLNEFIELAHKLKLGVLVEAHDEEEIARAIKCNAKVIGVNNRNLKDFTVNINNSIKLRSLVPSDVLFVSESGIRTRDDIKDLEVNNVDAVLIGETLMKSNDIGAALKELMYD